MGMGRGMVWAHHTAPHFHAGLSAGLGGGGGVGGDYFFGGEFLEVLEPLDAGDGKTPLTRLIIRVRGRWTSRLMPVWLGRLWVWLICREHARLLRKAL